MRKVVTVHPTTVQKAAKGEFKKGRKTPKKGSRNSRVVTVQGLDPMLVKWMKDNKVSLRDIETVVSPTQIILK